jgi:hypothetical protein
VGADGLPPAAVTVTVADLTAANFGVSAIENVRPALAFGTANGAAPSGCCGTGETDDEHPAHTAKTILSNALTRTRNTLRTTVRAR